MDEPTNEFDDLADDAQAFLDDEANPQAFNTNDWRDRLPVGQAVLPATSARWYVLNVTTLWDDARRQGYAYAYCAPVRAWLQALDRHGLLCILPMVRFDDDDVELRPVVPHNGTFVDVVALIGPDDDPDAYLARHYHGWEVTRHGEFPRYDGD